MAPAIRWATATPPAAAMGSSWAASAAAVPVVDASVDDDGEVAGGDPRCDVDIHLERDGTDLGEPEPVLLDEVESDPVRARRAGRGHGELELDVLAGSDGPRQGRARPVPDDRIAERIEPVERGHDAVLAVRAPRGGAGVLERDPGDGGDARSGRLERPGDPARCQRAGVDGMLADAFHDWGLL